MGVGNTTTIETNNHEDQYQTKTGAYVDKDGHSDEFMDTLNSKISDWITGSGDSPSEDLDYDELEYILDNMDDSENNPLIPSGHLSRAERAYHILPLIESGELKIGDDVPSSSTLRSYSKTQQATLQYMHRWEGTVIIYRTNNNVKQFNAELFDDTYSIEEECFVRQDKLKIDNIQRIKRLDFGPNFNFTVANELGALERDINAKEVIIIDVSPKE